MTRAVSWVLAATTLCWSTSLLADTPCVDVVNRQGRKLPGVSVTLGNWTKYTDQSGHVCFQNVPKGRYQLSLRSGDVTSVCDVSTERSNIQCQMPVP
jgi:hypothetical protein